MGNDGGGLGLAVGVPGGQQVYVSTLGRRRGSVLMDANRYIDPKCGRIGYTTPHSASMPMGALVEGW